MVSYIDGKQKDMLVRTLVLLIYHLNSHHSPFDITRDSARPPKTFSETKKTPNSSMTYKGNFKSATPALEVETINKNQASK